MITAPVSRSYAPATSASAIWRVTGTGAVEMVRVRGPERGNRPTGLRPRRGGGGVGMDHAADLRIALVQDQVRRRVRRRPEVAFDDPAVLEGDDHEMLRAKLVVGHAARLDDQDAGRRGPRRSRFRTRGSQARPAPDPGWRARPARAGRAATAARLDSSCDREPGVRLAEAAGQVVVRLVPAKLLLEARDGRVGVDQQELAPRPSRRSRR